MNDPWQLYSVAWHNKECKQTLCEFMVVYEMTLKITWGWFIQICFEIFNNPFWQTASISIRLEWTGLTYKIKAVH